MSSKLARWEHFEHEADIGIRGIGASPEEAFRQAALALTAVITDPAGVRPGDCIEVECQGPDLEMLLADWIDAIIYQMAIRGMLFSRFEIHISNHRLSATLYGEPIDRARHEPAVEVKGATLTELYAGEDPGGVWRAQCVIDV